MSVDLAALQTHLNGLGQPLVLAGSDQALGPLTAVVDSVPGHTISLDTTATPVKIEGSTLTVEGAVSTTWPIQGLAGATLQVRHAVFTVTTDGATTATVDAGLPVSGSVVADVTVQPGTSGGPGTWTVGLAQATQLISPTDLIALGLGGPLPVEVPSSLDVFGKLAVLKPGSLVIGFAPNTDGEANYAFVVTVPQASWKPVPGVIELDGIDVAAVITTRAWSVTLIGHLTVGTPVVLGITVGPGSVWSAYLAPDGTKNFPGIVKLADWFGGGGQLGPDTTQGFANLQLRPSQFDLALSRVDLSFDVDRGTVVSLQVESVMTVVGLQLTLVMLLPALTFTGSLTQPDVKVVDMLRSADLDASAVPDSLTITEARFLADAGAGHYSADVGVDGIWPNPPVELRSLTAGVDYAAEEFTGAFTATLALAGTSLDLYAGYPDAATGWLFSGGTTPGAVIDIGTLISDLGTQFGIQQVPDAIKSLKVTALHLDYATGTGAFHFSVLAEVDVESTPVDLVVTIAINKTSGPPPTDKATTVGTKGYTARFAGTVTFSDREFGLLFDVSETSDLFVADYLEKVADPLDLRELVGELSDSLAQAVPQGVTVDLTEVKFVLFKAADTRWAFGLRLGTTIDLSLLPVVGSRLPAGLDLAVENLQVIYASEAFDAATVSLINPLLPDGVARLPDTLAQGIDLQAVLRVGDVTKEIGTAVKPATPAALEARAAETHGAETVVEGPVLAAAAPAAPAAPAGPSATQPIHWVDVDKQFGIFTFRRVGVGYVDNVLEFALDASVALGPVQFSLVGLTVGSALDHFDPQFGLDGLELSFSRPPITLGGAFLRVKQTQGTATFDAYYGVVLISLPEFGLTALGGWAPDADPAFFFIYVKIKAPLGGPPFLFITGLAGGFGINSRLVLPGVEEVGAYPLLPQVAPEQGTSAADTMKTVLPVLQQNIQPQGGEYWVAAGISFTSFEMIQAQAVVSVAFGVEVQIGFVGTAAMTFPTGDATPVAYVEIDVVASYTPSTGLLAIAGRLSPASYVFGGFVKLTGGFALYAWFTGETQGDFVVSIGGYHPAYVKPDLYPVVPRLGISFLLGPLKVVGQAYFALTPGTLMAGISLDATFSAGPVSAWFHAGLDFLIAWAPFHYEARAWVFFGFKVDLGLFTISVQIGADLKLWGPAFGGVATVDLSVVTVTVAFGAPQQPPAPIGWATLSANFLPGSDAPAPAPKPVEHPRLMMMATVDTSEALAPAPTPVGADAPANHLTATVTVGLSTSTAPGFDWIIDPDQFRISTSTVIPANLPQWSTSGRTDVCLPNDPTAYQQLVSSALTSVPADVLPPGLQLALDPGTEPVSSTMLWQQDLHIGPMRKPGIKSYLTVSVAKESEDGHSPAIYVSDLRLIPDLNSSTAALWGDPDQTADLNGQRLVAKTLTGLDIVPVSRQPGQVNGIALLELLFAEGIDTGFAFDPPPAASPYTASGTVSDDGDTLTVTVGGAHTLQRIDDGLILSTLTDPWVAAQRTSVLDQLTGLGFGTPTSAEVSVSTLATTPLSDWPGVAIIGGPA